MVVPPVVVAVAAAAEDGDISIFLRNNFLYALVHFHIERI